MKNLKDLVLAALCATALVLSGLSFHRSAPAHKFGVVTNVTTVAATPKAHASTHKGGGSDAIDAVTTSVAGLQAAADKLVFDQWYSGPAKFTFESDDFLSGGSVLATPTAIGSATIANNTTAVFGKLSWRGIGVGTAAIVSYVTTGQTAAHRGILSLDTGSATTGSAGIARNAASTPNVVLGAGQSFTQRWYVQIPTLSDGTNTFQTFMGWTSGVAVVTDGCFATYSSASPQSGQIILRTCAASSCTTGTGGSAPTVVGGTWYHVTVTWDGTNCAATVDDTNIGSTASTIPTASVTPEVSILKSAGGTARTMLVDYYSELQIDAAGR